MKSLVEINVENILIHLLHLPSRKYDMTQTFSDCLYGFLPSTVIQHFVFYENVGDPVVMSNNILGLRALQDFWMFLKHMFDIVKLPVPSGVSRGVFWLPGTPPPGHNFF